MIEPEAALLRRHLQTQTDEVKRLKNLNKELKCKLIDSLENRRVTENLMAALKVAELVCYDAAQGAYDKTEAQEALAVVRSAIGVFKQESTVEIYGQGVTVEFNKWQGILR